MRSKSRSRLKSPLKKNLRRRKNPQMRAVIRTREKSPLQKRKNLPMGKQARIRRSLLIRPMKRQRMKVGKQSILRSAAQMRWQDGSPIPANS